MTDHAAPWWPINPLGIERIEDVTPTRRGRPQTVGRFTCRAELEAFIVDEYRSTPKVVYVAAAARVSEATVLTILGKKRRRPIRRRTA